MVVIRFQHTHLDLGATGSLQRPSLRAKLWQLHILSAYRPIVRERVADGIGDGHRVYRDVIACKPARRVSCTDN